MATMNAHGGNLDCAPAHPELVGRAEALKLLGVKSQTLYSYVSRGLVRRIHQVDNRRSLYSREDLLRLRARSFARSGHGPVAAGAMLWGEPVMATGITELTVDGPRYRDILATTLARGFYSFEAVSEYLWSGEMQSDNASWPSDVPSEMLATQLADVVRSSPDVHIRQLLSKAVMVLGWADSEQHPPRREINSLRARRLIHAMVGCFGYAGPSRDFIRLGEDEGIAHGLARALGLSPSDANVGALNAALILLADHEFTPATFAARIAASVDSDLYSCVGTALLVHFSSGLALRCDRVEQTLAPSGAASLPAPVSLGYMHPLYENGDPRARMLQELAIAIDPRSAIGGPTDSDRHATLDEALVQFCRALGLGRQVSGGVMALGRAAGWIAHILEQREQGVLIRPRARFADHA